MKRNSMVALVLTLMLITLTFIGCSPSETQNHQLLPMRLPNPPKLPGTKKKPLQILPRE